MKMGRLPFPYPSRKIVSRSCQTGASRGLLCTNSAHLSPMLQQFRVVTTPSCPTMLFADAKMLWRGTPSTLYRALRTPDLSYMVPAIASTSLSCLFSPASFYPSAVLHSVFAKVLTRWFRNPPSMPFHASCFPNHFSFQN